MDEDNTMDFVELLGQNIGVTGTELKDLEIGSKERSAEANIFDMQAKLALQEYKITNELSVEEAKLELEKDRINREITLKRDIEESRMAQEMEKFEKDLEMRRAIEVRRLEIEEKKAKCERNTLWAKVALAGVEVASGIGLGILYLKANLTYGNMMGKDGQNWFKEIRKIRL